MYNNGAMVSEIEDLVMDFLMFRKTKKAKNYQIQNQHEIGKGWPHYSSLELPPPESWELLFKHLSEGGPKHNTQSMIKDGQAYNANAELPLYTMDSSHGATEEEMKRVDGLFSEMCKMLHPCVHEVLSAYEYEGSPVYEDDINHAVIDQMVDKVMDHAGKKVQEVGKICEEKDGLAWGRKKLLKALVEALVLIELFGRRRPGYRKMFKDNWSHMTYL